jgi:hypothetical protein
MKRRGDPFLFWIMMGMELSWLSAGALFLTRAILNRSFPLPEAWGTLLLAAFGTQISMGKGWRIISILALHLLGFFLASLRTIYGFYVPPAPFWDASWVSDFFHSPRGVAEWLSLSYVLIWVLVLWLRGVALVRKPLTHAILCARFDIGIAAWVILFLIQLLVWVKGGIRIECPAARWLVFPFFLFGLLAIGRVRNPRLSYRNFLPGYQALGIILFFTLAVILFAAAIVLLFLPYLIVSAEIGLVSLKTVGRPLAHIFVAVIRFLYMRNVSRPETSSPSPESGLGDLHATAPRGWWMELMEKILTYGLGTLLGILGLILMGLGLYTLIRWLLSRTRRSSPGKTTLFPFLSWMEGFRRFWSFIRQRDIRGWRGYAKVGPIYGALQKWGKRSGFPLRRSETPQAYGLRLRRRFPQLKAEIETIIQGYQLEVYGEIPLAGPEFSSVRRSWRKLRSPRHWPNRLKRWFTGPWD